MSDDQQPVRFQEHATAAGGVVAHAELNVAATLNSLSLEMVRLLTPVLEEWKTREEVVCVVITGAGEKAFCAGGDIQALYRAIGANQAANAVVDDYPFRFFEEEYRLDFLIHTYPKPLVTLGHGIVMGGGFGIFSASRYRVLTERSRLAFPEITIGLFPDAGGSWVLRNMAPHHAAFLGLTGSQINATDALNVGVGTHVVPHDQRTMLLAGLMGLAWSKDAQENQNVIQAWLETLPKPELPDGELHLVPQRDVDASDWVGEANAIYALAGRSPWIDRGIANLRNGCPTTAGIVLEQLARVGSLSLAESFQMELIIGTHCAQNPDFHEGVRALLIDKDNNPRWQFGSLEAVPREYVLSHFEAPWPEHPMADLTER